MPLPAGTPDDDAGGLVDVVQGYQPGVEGCGHVGGDGCGVLGDCDIDVPVQPSQKPITDEAADYVAVNAARVEDVLQVGQE